MAYIPNNSILYNHAIAGAIGAVAARWNTDATQADYAPSVDGCVALAQAVDTAIPAGEYGDNQADLLGRIVGGICQDRYLQSVTAADYTDIAAGIVALYNQAVLSFA